MGPGFKLKRKNIGHVQKSRDTGIVEFLENGNYHVYRKLFQAPHLLKWIPVAENCKNQGIKRIKSKKINRTVKLCTLATNNLILS